MAIESPLFQSSMELLGHAISHFTKREELDRKLVILHLANAIELVLKDLVLNEGESIYKNPKETITIHSCIQILKSKSITIPFLNKIELLIDERNALQHRFGSPNELTTTFYINIAINFFKEILSLHYGQEYEEIIAQFSNEKDLMAFKLHEPNNDEELEKLQQLAKIHPLGALLSAMTYFEKTILEFSEKIGLDKVLKRRPIGYITSYKILERYGIKIPENLSEELEEVRRLRNLVAHGRKEPTENDVKKAIKSIEEFEKYLTQVNIEQVKKIVNEELQKEYEEYNKKYEAKYGKKVDANKTLEDE